MARPLRYISADEQARWDHVCRAWQSGDKTIEDIMVLTGLGRSSVYARLKEAAFRIEDEILDRNQAAYDAKRIAIEADAPQQDRPDLDELTFVTLTSAPGEEFRRTVDPQTGEDRFIRRPHYNLITDELEVGLPGSFLIGSGPGEIRGRRHGKQRMRTFPGTGQHLTKRHAGWGNLAEPGGPTSYKPDAKLKGGVG